ncbi:MAG TPA: glycosyltransferase [Verrucomicrobiae bacterium]|nr:glycosyltransferase [Verrucomicrobiae bacterium]
MDSTPQISVVIPTHNRATLLGQSLDSLVKQVLGPNEYEVIVVDDGSTDDTREVCLSMAPKINLKYVYQQNGGIGSAKNRAIRECAADLILFFDDDDVANENLLSQHVGTHREHPEVNVAVLGYTDWHPSMKPDCLMRWMLEGGFLFDYGHIEHGRRYDYTYFWGGRSSCKRRLLEERGLFNPQFTFGSEDIELGYRLSQHGFHVVFNKNAKSSMIRKLDFDGFLARCQRQGRSQVWFSRMHPAPEVQKWCQTVNATGIWDFLKIDFERNVQRARQLGDLVNNQVSRRVQAESTESATGPSASGRKARGDDKLNRAIELLHGLYWKVFTAAKYKGIVEEMQKGSGVDTSVAIQRQERPAAPGQEPARSGGRGRILFIDLFIPAFNRASGCLRTFQLLKMLRELDYEVTFLSRYPQYADEYAPFLEELGIEVIAGDPLALEATGGRAVCPLVNYEQLLRGRRWDLAVISFWDNAEYYLPLLRKCSPGTPVVIDTVDIVFLRKIREAEIQANGLARAEALRNKEREIAIYRKADRLWVVTEADRAAIQSHVPEVPIDVLSNIHAVVEETKSFGATKDLLFVGNFWHLPNVDAMGVFCQLIFPLIQRRRPDIKLLIVGDNVPEFLREFQSDSIQFLGHVPDLAPWLRSARVSIAPLRYGAGMKGKIGEALSWGLPVVTTEIGAEGMDLQDGLQAMIANTPAAFAEAVLRVYDDEALWTKLSVTGKAKVQSDWGYDVVKRKVAEAVSRVSLRQPDTSIIILTHNQLAHTKLCLQSIENHTPERYELILVDNGSTDGTPEFLREYERTRSCVRVIRNDTNRGFAAANNQGLAVARAKYVLLLNNDTVVTKNWLGRMLAVFDRFPEVGLVGPVSNYVSGPQLVKGAAYKTLDELPSFAERWAAQHAGESQKVHRLVGFCLLARRAVIEKIGGLDERFGSGNFEDDDFCLRAGLVGFKARIAQDAFIHHTGSQTFRGANIDYRQAMLRNWELFKKKWSLPADAAIEKGYRLPLTLANAESLVAPLPGSEQTTRVDAAKLAKRKTAGIVLPPCALIGHLGPARELLRGKKPRDAWEATLAVLKVRPFHPEAYLFLAEIAQATGDSTSARLCAEHARRLAPGWKPARRFLNQRLKGAARVDWLTLPDSVTSDPSRVASRLTVCLIAKNEEKFIGQCLASVRGLADQIVVVDTGSTDRTVEIANEHGAEVHSFVWCDDFSAARNAALEHARGDWVLMLDADEELTAEGREIVREEMRAGDVIAYRLPIVDEGCEEEGHSYVPRLFRNAPALFYVGRIHEQVFSSVEVRRAEWGLENKFSRATLRHHGYTEQMSRERDKNTRNLRLLELAIQEMPDEPNLLMNYGLELARAGKPAAALDQYREAFHALEALPENQVVPELRESLVAQLCTQLMAANKYQELIQMLGAPLARRGGLTASLHFGLGLAHMELKNYREAAEQFRQCLAKRDRPSLVPMNRDIRKAGPHHCLATCLMHLGEFDAAGEAFQRALAADPQSRRVRFDLANFLFSRGSPVEALTQLHALVAENAGELPVWLLGGRIALSQPEFLEFACDWTAEAIKYFPQERRAVLQRAEALLLAGRVEEAWPWLGTVDPSSDATHQAAQIVCGLVAGDPLTTVALCDEPGVSREFLSWYRRLVRWGATGVVLKLNENVQGLKNALPTAAAALEAALSEACQPMAV